MLKVRIIVSEYTEREKKRFGRDYYVSAFTLITSILCYIAFFSSNREWQLVVAGFVGSWTKLLIYYARYNAWRRRH